MDHVFYKDAMFYSMNNRYLSLEEKKEVEFWYQLPGNLSLITFLIIIFISSFIYTPWYVIIGIPLFANITIGIINWHFYNKKVLLILYLTILHNTVLWIITLLLFLILIYKGDYVKAIIVLLLKLILNIFFEPYHLLYSIMSRSYGMHPKYVFFKKYYNHEFPFEKE